MARNFDAEDIAAWLEQQILATQIDWMNYYVNGQDALRAQQEAVLDGIYAFREYFLEVPAPAPGQGYEPPAEVWQGVINDRKLMEIDAKISALVAEREAITGPPS